jgi:hypothetical protein
MSVRSALIILLLAVAWLVGTVLLVSSNLRIGLDCLEAPTPCQTGLVSQLRNILANIMLFPANQIPVRWMGPWQLPIAFLNSLGWAMVIYGLWGRIRWRR